MQDIRDIVLELDNLTLDSVVLTDVLEELVQSVLTFLSTPKGSIPNMRYYGNRLDTYLQDNLTDALISAMKQSLIDDARQSLGITPQVSITVDKNQQRADIEFRIPIADKTDLVLNVIRDKFGRVTIKNVKLLKEAITFEIEKT